MSLGTMKMLSIAALKEIEKYSLLGNENLRGINYSIKVEAAVGKS